MKTVLLLGGPAAGQRAEVHGTMVAWITGDTIYKIVPMCSHGEVHWFGVLPGADPLALLIAGYATSALQVMIDEKLAKGIDAAVSANALTGGTPAPVDYGVCDCGRPGKFS